MPDNYTYYSKTWSEMSKDQIVEVIFGKPTCNNNPAKAKNYNYGYQNQLAMSDE